MARMGVRAYAKRRGISHVAVIKAIKDGRLSGAVKLVDGKPQIDPDLADREWPPSAKELFQDERGYKPGLESELEARSKTLEIDADGEIVDRDENGRVINYARILMKARALREDYNAKRAKLELDRAAGKLVEAAVVKKEWAAVASLARTKILGVPSKLKQKRPEISDDVYRALENIVREALEDLSSGD